MKRIVEARKRRKVIVERSKVAGLGDGRTEK